MQSLAGKVAIVTGAGSGIGQRIAHVMAERGAKILVAASREERASGTTKSIRDAGGIAESVYGDLADINVPEKNVQAENGRAACREREGQDVVNQVVERSLKKKQN